VISKNFQPVLIGDFTFLEVKNYLDFTKRQLSDVSEIVSRETIEHTNLEWENVSRGTLSEVTTSIKLNFMHRGSGENQR
jgi:hypothetical protein